MDMKLVLECSKGMELPEWVFQVTPISKESVRGSIRAMRNFEIMEYKNQYWIIPEKGQENGSPYLHINGFDNVTISSADKKLILPVAFHIFNEA